MRLTKKTLFGDITVIEEDGKLVALEFGGDEQRTKSSPLLDKLFSQLELYFAGKLRDFDIPLAPKGTPFQQQVWAQLLKIPFGETASYKEIAKRVNNPDASRAIGMANHRNPISILIPCHRVIAANGNLSGYGGGIEMKMKLLNLEYGENIWTTNSSPNSSNKK